MNISTPFCDVASQSANLSVNQSAVHVVHDCEPVKSDFKFWFHGVFSLCLNAVGTVAAVLFAPILFHLFRDERKKRR